MTDPKRIVLVDDDPGLVATLESTFGAPDFVVHAFSDHREALLQLHDVRPDLILCSLDMPVMPGRSFLRLVKRSEQLSGVPFVFLGSDHTREDVVGCLEDGADDLLSKPVDTPLLAARLRALLRLADRPVVPEERSDALTGSVGAAGALRLLRLCEDFRLTGRLTVEDGAVRHCVDFSGGELLQAVREPPQSDGDPLDSLLALTAGSYRIEQARMDARARGAGEVEASSAPAVEASHPAPASGPSAEPARLPGGRLSMIKSRSGDLQIQTEGENRPFFAVTTVVVRGGRVLRRIETTWQHPLQRRDDEALAKQQIDQQHDRVVASLRELALEGTPRRDAVGASERRADGPLLAWTVERVTAHAHGRLGSVATAALLRRTQKRGVDREAGAASFVVDDHGSVRFEEKQPRVTHETMRSVIAWLKEFLNEVAGLDPEAAQVDVREVTRQAAEDLKRLGFYSAFDAS